MTLSNTAATRLSRERPKVQSLSPLLRVRAEIDLPVGVAIWVLTAHAYTLLSPLALSWVVHTHFQALSERVYSPVMLHVAVAIFCSASAFELSQNTVDRWYLTPESGSAWGVGFCDFLFWLLLIAGMGALVIAAVGFSAWLVGTAALALVAYPFIYLTLGTPFPALGLAGTAACVALYLRFENPMVFYLALGPSAVLMYFFTLLLQTGNQAFHGFATSSSAFGLLAATWAIDASLRGEPSSWLSFAVSLLVLGILAVALRPWLSRTKATVCPNAYKRDAPQGV